MPSSCSTRAEILAHRRRSRSCAHVRRGMSCLDAFFSLIFSLLCRNALCSYSAWHGPFAVRVHELVAAAGFLGASLSFLNISSGSTPPQLSSEELLSTRWDGLWCSSRYTQTATCLPIDLGAPQPRPFGRGRPSLGYYSAESYRALLTWFRPVLLSGEYQVAGCCYLVVGWRPSVCFRQVGRSLCCGVLRAHLLLQDR